MVWPGGMSCIWYGLVGMTRYMEWSSGDFAWYMAWSGGHGMVYDVVWWHGMVYGMTCCASHGICIGLARCGMVYVIVWWGMAWYMVWPVGHDIVYRIA